jgi:DNA-binding response OmpR family regulator
MQKILIVEDKPDLLTLVKNNLENRGFSVVSVR